MQETNPSATATKDGGIVAYASASITDTTGDSSIRIPQADTSMGAGFGEEIIDENRRFAADREPVAGFLIYGVAADVCEKWFKINNADTEGDDPELNKLIQTEFKTLKFKQAFKQLVEFERLYGKALLVGSFDDVNNVLSLRNPRREDADLLQVVAYPRTQFKVSNVDHDPTSLRFGLPLSYKISLAQSHDLKESSQTELYTEIHWTRCYEAQTRTNGNSTLDLIWDDLTCGRNIRWGVGQWVFRVGGGFAVIKFPKETGGQPTTREQLQTWAASKEWSNITHRTYIAILNEVMDFKFEGAAGAILNPEPFFDSNTKQISKATGFPKSILEGAEAGALTGSEKNDQQYYKKISGIQSDFEDAIRWVIDAFVGAGRIGGVTPQQDAKPVGNVIKRMLHKVAPSHFKEDASPQIFNYEIEWNSAFELDEVKEAQIDLMTEQANSLRLEYMTKDEVRATKEGLKDLPNGEGKTLKAPASFGASPNSNNPFQQQQGQGQGQGSQNQNNNQQEPSNPSQDAKVNALHSEFADQLNQIIKKAKLGALTKDAAISEAEHLILNYSKQRERDALDYLSKKTGQHSPLLLPPEMQLQLDSQSKMYMQQFRLILEDALKNVQ